VTDLRLLESPEESGPTEPTLVDDPTDPEADPYLTRMLPRFGPVATLLARVAFRHIRSDDEDLVPIRDAAIKGSVVYVMRTRSLLDYVYFNWLAVTRKLPLARWANGVHPVLLGPLLRTIRVLWRTLRNRRQRGGPAPSAVNDGWVSELLQRGDSILVFLRRRRGRFFGKEPPPERDIIELLVEAQQRREEPIFVVPQVLVWERGPDRSARGLIDVLLGDQDDPGRFRKLLHFVRHSRNAVVRVGEPVNLREFLADQQGQPMWRTAKKLRWLLLGYLYRERRVVKGPDVRPRRWIFDRILREAPVRAAIEAQATREGKPIEAIQRNALKQLDRMAANFRWWVVVFMAHAMDFVFSRIYTGVEFAPEDAERLRRAARSGTVLLMPCHRSHIDYLLISWLMVRHGIMPPHIAAGINLSFFPMGPIFRRSGAFFLKRSFQDDPLYGELLTHYIRALVSEGYTQEFFIEGGRSRTGKMLPPKVGLLATYVGAVADGIVPDIQIVPISIAYERIVEEKTYAEELGGGKKKRETAAGLVKAGGVLARRFGRVYVTCNEPVSMKEALGVVGRPYRELGAEERKVYLKRLGQHIVAEIQDVTVVTPSAVTALVLLGHDRQGLPHLVFHRRAKLMREWLTLREARFSEAWSFPEMALDEAVNMFADSGSVERLPGGDDDILAIDEAPTKRMALDYYKNSILFHFVPAAFVCTALLLDAAKSATVSVICRRFEYLQGLFTQEFFFHPDLPVEHLVDETVDQLRRLGVVIEEPGSEEGEPVIRAVDGGKAAIFVSTIANFYEAYWVVLKAAKVLRDGPLTEKQLVAATLDAGRLMFLTEDVTRPEAVGQVNLTNAVRHFASMGVFLSEGEASKPSDRLWTLDEEQRKRYMGPMRRLFESSRLRAPSVLWR
jgi:glycerol-3-phosphate O-acyltransferase